MSKVDPLDIRPPTVLLVQALSDKTEMVNKNGKEAKDGQFFHTGKKKVWDTFDCYILFASKGTYIDRRKPDEGEKDKYSAIGILKEDIEETPPLFFGMSFKVSSLFALSPLFQAVQSQHAPMFSFNVTFEKGKAVKIRKKN